MDLWLILYVIIAYVIWLAIERCMRENEGDTDSGKEGGTGDESPGGGGKGDSGGDDTVDGGDGSSGGESEGSEEDTGDGVSEDDGEDHHSGNPWEKNLLKNNCGQDNFQYWKIMMNGGDGWSVEGVPIGVNPLPKTEEGNDNPDFGKNTGCFATGGDMCLKEQLIDLLEEGFTESELDSQPLIQISEWYACHPEKLGDYVLNVTLLSKEKRNMGHSSFYEDFSTLPRKEWHKVSKTFSEYGSGLRYVSFNHGGKSREKLPGHYGCRISGGVIKLVRTSEL
ncbi:hypothetical protein J437_LFUL002710 [Ladona fulva]|uniref:FBA domain-containing protein n=1 Tax=Ladona fulva TaxID=123851 RepID=A0A8K0JW56_LADFU|nr:hypothetical protein J437_LFUL002710 [Ladona fulva]